MNEAKTQKRGRLDDSPSASQVDLANAYLDDLEAENARLRSELEGKEELLKAARSVVSDYDEGLGCTQSLLRKRAMEARADRRPSMSTTKPSSLTAKERVLAIFPDAYMGTVSQAIWDGPLRCLGDSWEEVAASLPASHGHSVLDEELRDLEEKAKSVRNLFPAKLARW